LLLSIEMRLPVNGFFFGLNRKSSHVAHLLANVLATGCVNLIKRPVTGFKTTPCPARLSAMKFEHDRVRYLGTLRRYTVRVPLRDLDLDLERDITGDRTGDRERDRERDCLRLFRFGGILICIK